MRAHCSICQDSHLLQEFRFLPCGHGFCLPSLEHYVQQHTRKPCPICRVFFRLSDVLAVFIEGDPDAPRSQAAPASDAANDPPYPAAVLRQAAQKEQLTALQSDLRAAGTEKDALRQDAEHARCLASSAVDTADKARHELVGAREEAERLRRRVEAQGRQHREQLAAKAKEARGLWDTVLAHKDKEAKQKAKIAALRQQVGEHEATIGLLRSRAIAPARRARWRGSERSTPTPAFNPDEDLEILDAYPTQDNTPLTDTTSNSDLGFLDPDSSRPLPPLFPTPCSQPSFPAPATPQRPIFGTDWNLKPPEKRRRVVSADTRPSTSFPIAVDEKGRPKGAVQLGSRQKLKFG
ncbi:predicted protein [Postia placenta Mad-698-R]|nr:predicted protein [Postia placenta Mad-698-R]